MTRREADTFDKMLSDLHGAGWAYWRAAFGSQADPVKRAAALDDWAAALDTARAYAQAEKDKP